MSEYHKIQTVFLRDPENNHKTLLEGHWARPEFQYLAHNPWVWTEKVDGTNIRVSVNPLGDGAVKFGGRTDNAQIPAFLLDALAAQFQTPEQATKLAEQFPDGAVLYGEGYGAKIQKGGGNYRSDQSFVLFDVRVGKWWLERQDVEEIAGTLGIEVAPVIGVGTLPEMVRAAKEGINSRWGDFVAEGIVARPETELFARDGKRIITKIKCKDFAP